LDTTDVGSDDVEVVRRVASLLSDNWVEIFGDPELRAERVERLTPLLHPNFVYRSTAIADQLGFADEYRGAEGFIEASLQFVEEFEYFSTDPQEYIDLGDGRVLVHGWNVIRTVGGDEMRFPGSAVATIEDGRLRRYESFGDRSEAERAAGLV
jgi:ketosteroid isomerase-like protein